MSRHYRSSILLFGILLSSCTPPQVTEPAFPAEAHKAKAYMDQGEPAKAAQVYRRIADEQSEFQDQLRLFTIESLIQAGDSETAKNYADAIEPANLTLLQRNLLNLYYAQIDLSFGEAEQAIDRLNLVKPPQLSRSDQIKYHQSRAFAYSLTGELQKSAAARVELSGLLNPAQQQANYSAILETLSLLPSSTLEKASSETSGTLSGWIDLAHLLKFNQQNRTALNAALDNWRQNHPRHPANSPFLDSYLAQSNNAFKKPGKIAVFLPETGSIARAGKAIREGIMAAYYKDRNESKPDIRFYDSGQSALPILYHQAIAEGAELIIGPLSKPDIESLSSTDLNIPVLALNHVPEISKPNLYQFGLSPIDDAEQIVSKAWFDGRQNALILIPNSEQGARIGEYFREYWDRADANVLEIQTYRSNQSDFSEPIKKLLNLDESEQRYQKIRQFIPTAVFVPRIRRDADVLFLNAYETAGRSINPQLSFFHAQHIPVYATPQIYSGLPNPQLDMDLNKITFCDVPWLFDNVYPGELSRSALRSTWQQFPSIYLRLIAMGIDAYNLVPHLDKLDTVQYQGATGNLLLTREGRIKRNLVCAKFSQGLPNVIGFVKSSAGGYESIATPFEDDDLDEAY